LFKKKDENYRINYISHLEIKEYPPRLLNEKYEIKRVDGKFASLALKLSYNALKEVDGLYEWCSLNFAYPSQIAVLDLSFNCFECIPAVSNFILLQFLV
jgi:Leucine-rich repeat (LRR) protein